MTLIDLHRIAFHLSNQSLNFGLVLVEDKNDLYFILRIRIVRTQN